MIQPAMPSVAAKVQEQIPYDFNKAQWDEAGVWGKMETGVKLVKGASLFPRIDLSSLEIKEEEIEEKALVLKEEIEYGDFDKLDLRIAKILKAEKVEKADKLLKFEVEFGKETRTVVSGIAKYYKPEDLVGKKVILVANLKPVKIRGIESQGMILSASLEDDSDLELITINKDFPSGTTSVN